MNNDFPKLRQAMVDCQVRTTDVTQLSLLDAMLDVERERFVPTNKMPFAYIDEDIALKDTSDGSPQRYLMAPSEFARLVQLADVKPSDLVLDIGCGTGYAAAVLSRLASAVISIDSDSELVARATQTLGAQGFDSVVVLEGDLASGYPDEGPYDVVFVAGAVEFVPDSWLDQLKRGGRMVVVEGFGSTAFAKLYVRDDEGHIGARRAFNLSVKPLPGFQKTHEFVF